MLYEDADLWLNKGRTKKSRFARKYYRDTVLQREEDGSIVARLWSTKIVRWNKDGSIQLHTNGAPTARNRFWSLLYKLPVKVDFLRGIWSIHLRVSQDAPGGHLMLGRTDEYWATYAFINDMIITPVENQLGVWESNHTEDFYDKLKERQKIMNQTLRYSKAFYDRLVTGWVPVPSANDDCWLCLVSPFSSATVSVGDTMQSFDHLREHMANKDYVPSLLMNACGDYGGRFYRLSSLANPIIDNGSGMMLINPVSVPTGWWIIKVWITSYLRQRLLPKGY